MLKYLLNLVVLCFTLFIPKAFAQDVFHQVVLYQKNTGDISEIKITKDNELVGLQQFDKKNRLVFAFEEGVNSEKDFRADYHDFSQPNTQTILSADVASGLSVIRIKKNFNSERYYHNGWTENKNIDKRTLYRKIKDIKDSTAMKQNAVLQKIMKKMPNLVTVKFDSKGKILKDEQYHNGKIIGRTNVKVSADYKVVQLVDNDGNAQGLDFEYENGKPSRINSGTSSNTYAYNSNGNLAQKTTLQNGLPTKSTINTFDGDKILTKEITDEKTGKKIIYNYTYNSKGMFDTISKKDGNNIKIFKFHYTYR